MAKNFLALSNGGNENNQSRTPFVIACELIAKLSRVLSGLDLRVKSLESLPQARDGRDGVGIKGDKGDSGLDGKSITKVKIDQEGNLLVTIGDIENNLGRIIGKDGLDGKSVTDVKIDNNNHLIIYLDGVEKDLGNVKGPAGENGKDGIGIVGEKGNPGESVKGEKGDRGQDGESIKGDPGQDGKDGKDFDEKELIRLDNEILSIRNDFSRLSQVPKMTNGELARRIEDLTGKSVRID